jgi:hypothetical protein
VTHSGFSPSSNDSLIERLRRATIGRYDIYAELGAGGMATVYLALDLALERKVAIKVLNPTLASSADNIERFKREAKVAASLNHPNIIGIIAVGDDPGLAYFVMKYVEGRALDSVVRDMGAQDIPFVRSVIGTVGKALHYAHSRGVVHRDVKPANFMLDKDGWLVVTDFGIAKIEDASGLTMTGSVIGTPYYMAPEQFQGKPVTAAADQYALGVVAFELLTGRQPFAGDTVAEVMKGHLFDPVPSVRALRPDVPEALEATITRMLAKDPAERFASLDDAVTAFGAVTGTQEREVRTQMINLAISGAMEKPQIHVPVSPSPAVRARPQVSQVDRTLPMTGALPRPRSRVAWVVGFAAVAALALFAAQWRRETTAPIAAPAPASDSAAVDSAAAERERREREIRDSISAVVAATLRDSIAREDSLKRIASARAADSAADVQAANQARRQRRQQLIRDSLAALLAARRERIDTAVPAPMPPTTIPGSMVYGRIRIGSRCPDVFLYIGDDVRPIRALQTIEILSGEKRLEIRSRTRTLWDTTFTVEPGRLQTIGFRPNRCR